VTGSKVGRKGRSKSRGAYVQSKAPPRSAGRRQIRKRNDDAADACVEEGRSTAEALLANIESSAKETKSLEFNSRKYHRKALALVYRHYRSWEALEMSARAEVLRRLPTLAKSHKAVPAGSERSRRTNGNDAARAILTAMIKYPGEKRGTDNQLISRDAMAIKYAASLRIEPDKFVEKITASGAGILRWAAEWAKANPKSPSVRKPRTQSGVQRRKATKDAPSVAGYRRGMSVKMEKAAGLKMKRPGEYIGIFSVDDGFESIKLLHTEFIGISAIDPDKYQDAFDAAVRTLTTE
jgi:hypothetical protein